MSNEYKINRTLEAGDKKAKSTLWEVNEFSDRRLVKYYGERGGKKGRERKNK